VNSDAMAVAILKEITSRNAWSAPALKNRVQFRPRVLKSSTEKMVTPAAGGTPAHFTRS
jgi:hypothetical protein